MAPVDALPRETIESAAELRLPPATDRRLQHLMDLNSDGQLTPDQREELASLVELSQSISLLRAKALRALGRSPS
jgi:hypothetical protein